MVTVIFGEKGISLFLNSPRWQSIWDFESFRYDATGGGSGRRLKESYKYLLICVKTYAALSSGRPSLNPLPLYVTGTRNQARVL